MKIGMPKIRLSRKLLFIVLGMLGLLGGTGGAALYLGSDQLLGEPKENVVGNACTNLQTMVFKTPEKRLWLRKYIRMEGADGPTRIKTALRIAGLAAKAYQVDLIQVNVLDIKGPEKRAQIRGRAIGAEVLIAMNPRYLPEMKEPFVARYFEGEPNPEGFFYGERVSLDLGEVRDLMGKMKAAEDKEDCVEPEKPEDEAAKADDKNAHGEKKANDHGEKPAANDHGEKPAAHGETAKEGENGEPAKAGEHGEPAKAGEHGEPAKEGENAGHEPAAAKEQGFVDSMMSMVGLGGSEEPAAEHGEKPADEAAADHAAPAEGHDAPAEDNTAPAEDHAAPAEEGKQADTAKEGENAGHEPAAAEKEQGFVDSMMNMVGLGGSEEPAADHGEKPAKDHAAPAEDHAAPVEDHATPAEDHAAPAEDHATPTEDHAAEKNAPAEDGPMPEPKSEH